MMNDDVFFRIHLRSAIIWWGKWNQTRYGKPQKRLQIAPKDKSVLIILVYESDYYAQTRNNNLPNLSKILRFFIHTISITCSTFADLKS